jgi:hypothetical protein
MLFTKPGRWRNNIDIKERRINQTSGETEIMPKGGKNQLKINLKIAPNAVTDMKVALFSDSNEVVILVLQKDGGLFFVPIIERLDSAGIV